MVSGLEAAGGSRFEEILMRIMYYLAGFILVMVAPIIVTMLYGASSPQLMTFSFILYVILAGIMEGIVSTPILPASIDVALALIALFNYASLYSLSSEVNITLLPLFVVERHGGHSVIAPDFSQVSLLILLFIHRDRLRDLAKHLLSRASRRHKEI